MSLVLIRWIVINPVDHSAIHRLNYWGFIFTFSHKTLSWCIVVSVVSTGLKKTLNTTYGFAIYHFDHFLSLAQRRLFALKNYVTGLACFFWFRCSHIPLHSANHRHSCGRFERHSANTPHHPGQCMQGSRRRLKWISVQRSGRSQTPGYHQFCNYVKQTKQKLSPLLWRKRTGVFFVMGKGEGRAGLAT